MKMLDGYKTHIVGVSMIVIGALELASFDVVPSVNPGNASDYIAAGLAMMTFRDAMKKG